MRPEITIHQMVKPDSVGSAYGYRIKTARLIDELSKNFDFVPGGNVSLSFVPPGDFQRAENGSFTWMVTTVENKKLSDGVLSKLRKADGVIVPSEWCRKVITKYIRDTHCFVVPHGVDPVFSYKERSIPPSKYHRFRYLYVGAKTPRKGLDQLLWLWDRLGFRKRLNVELYVKVNTEREDRLFNQRVSIDNVMIDCREIPQEELRDLYHSAHCFVLPTRGEGFGLTLAEAMRTGLPCIATDWSGHRDYFDISVGYPVESIEVEMDQRLTTNWCITEEQMEIPEEERKTLPVRTPRADQLAGAMIHVAQKYYEALEKGRKAHERMVNYTWERSGELFKNLLYRFHDGIWEVNDGTDR